MAPPINISSDHMITSTLNAIDSVLNHYVENIYTNFLNGYHGTILTLITLYFVWLGYQIISEQAQPAYSLIIKKIFLLSFVYALIFKWNVYNTLFYNIFTNEPQNMATVFAGATGQTVDAVLDNTFLSIINLAFSFFGRVSLSVEGLEFLIYGVFVFILGVPLGIASIVLFIYSKVAMAITLALGPMFILCLMWESTKGYFTAWVNKLVTFALIPVITTGILSLMLTIINTLLPPPHVESANFYKVIAFLILCVSTVAFLAQVFRIASALGGGLALSGIGSAAHAAIGSTGAHAAREWLKKKREKKEPQKF